MIFIPNTCAVPVIAPNTNGFFIVGIVAVVNTIAAAKPTHVKSQSVKTSAKEFAFVSFSKIEITTVVMKKEIKARHNKYLFPSNFQVLQNP